MNNEQENLTEAIGLLKKKQAIELTLLKEQIHTIHESINPINMLKKTIRQVTTSSEIKGSILDAMIGLASGYVSKKIFVGTSHNPIKHIAGALLQMGITNISSKNADTIKSIGDKIIQFVFKKQNRDELKTSTPENKYK
jgi:hypothetical protein